MCVCEAVPDVLLFNGKSSRRDLVKQPSEIALDRHNRVTKKDNRIPKLPPDLSHCNAGSERRGHDFEIYG